MSSLQFNSVDNRTNLGSGGGPGEANIQTGAEGSGSAILVLDTIHGTVNVVIALVHGVQGELLEHAPGEQETGAVGGGIVGQTNLDSVPGVTSDYLGGISHGNLKVSFVTSPGHRRP